VTNTPTNPIIKGLLRTIYVAHLVVSALFATYIIIDSPPVVSLTVTFVMLLIYGYMGVWVLLIGFLLVVSHFSLSCARTTRRPPFSVESS
jgi:hypothetical protein